MSEVTVDLNPVVGPQKEDNPFTPDDRDWWNNACLHRSHHVLDLYATGFKEAADVLVEEVSETRHRQDVLVFPIGFLYRHYIELRLKEIVKTGRELLDEDGGAPTGHNLTTLWGSARAIIEKVWPEASKDDLNATEGCLSRFAEADPGSDGFRYPCDRSGNPTLSDVRQINLRNLKEVVDRLSVVLDGASTGISVYLDDKLEMMAQQWP